MVNCSYPDATHALLAAEGLCPAVGIGNVTMVQACVEEVLRRQGHNELIRMVGHHAQTVPVLTSAPLEARMRLWIFVGEDGDPEHDLALSVEPIAWSKFTNVLTAAACRTHHLRITARRVDAADQPAWIGGTAGRLSGDSRRPFRPI